MIKFLISFLAIQLTNKHIICGTILFFFYLIQIQAQVKILFFLLFFLLFILLLSFTSSKKDLNLFYLPFQFLLFLLQIIDFLFLKKKVMKNQIQISFVAKTLSLFSSINLASSSNTISIRIGNNRLSFILFFFSFFFIFIDDD